ncbi:retropepsin-like aspartic protease family protein [Sphingomonas morindae]|uniref:Retroviral-like aspartic protease family protein n=1 Tax=Sphingomonas morindae TaxID=1541170 RepID=A0ABY4X512_9SPHN|nr:retropepsin-like aspartic protease [Sphingomonas morindae]USI71945.1 retroviral-like aspartic protease family protein [Sphingomonas morindae]
MASPRRLAPALIGAALLAAAVPAPAQIRVLVAGGIEDVPAGVVRVITEDAQGRRSVADEPFAGVATPGAATITTTEESEEDGRGRLVSRRIVTRIMPIALAAAAMPVREARFAPPRDGAAFYTPPPRLALDEQALAEAPAAEAVLDSQGQDDPAPARLAEADRAGAGGVLRIARDSETGHFIAPVRINGVIVRAIVDTGAQETILSVADAQATGADRATIGSEPMAGIGGMTQLAVARLRSLEVGGQRLGACRVAIGAPGIPYTLLGQTEIGRLGRIVIEGGVMTITAPAPAGQTPLRVAAR